jgi:hypothetical protein
VLSIWQAPTGMGFGWGITIKDPSKLDRVTFGSPYVTAIQTLRVLNMGFPFLLPGGVYAGQQDQVFAGAFPAAIINGRKRPTVGIPFPDDADNIERQSVLGYATADQQFTNPNFPTWNTTFQIEQM